ncbi:hypothetical protein OSB04_010487 [Centaurea solstitialis]|uniref:NADP-dependent oxidoreductase domain-containing protein n=1 Tax=Centaurea solstitialis TaxID=347529 RepID=A0AA38TF90_9ASTR|nr:hypothetical protein OSB04_010487 [Centaurea solstitialis]
MASTIPKVKLGSQGLVVSAQGLGCMGMTGSYMTGSYGHPKPEPDMIKLIHHAVDSGVTFLDTSDVYGPHTNEILVGKVSNNSLISEHIRLTLFAHDIRNLRTGRPGFQFGENFEIGVQALKQGGLRDKVQIATKFGIQWIDGETDVRGDPAYVRSACEASLKRLDVDCIDLYYAHRIDTRVPIEVTSSLNLEIFAHSPTFSILETPLELNFVQNLIFFHFGEAVRDALTNCNEKMGELKKLVEEGKVKYIGLSEASGSTIRRAHAVHPITAVQNEWSLWTRDLEDDIVPTCRELGIGIVPYSPIGRGFLAVGPKLAENLIEGDFRKTMPRFQNADNNKTIFERVNSMAARKGCSAAQLALAWVHHQGSDVVPIPGTTKVENFNQNIVALSVKLSAEEMAELESFASGETVKGERHSNMQQTWTNSETPPLSSWKGN